MQGWDDLVGLLHTERYTRPKTATHPVLRHAANLGPDVDWLYISINRPQPSDHAGIHKVSANDWAIAATPQWPDGIG